MVDASEGQIFIIIHHANMSHLYISEAEGYRYSLSLQHVVYFNPEGANSDTWLR